MGLKSDMVDNSRQPQKQVEGRLSMYKKTKGLFLPKYYRAYA